MFSNYATEPGARNRLVGLGNSQTLYRKLALSVCTGTADSACEDLCFFCLARKNFLSKRACCKKQNRPGDDDKEPLSNNIGLERTTKGRCQTTSAWRGRQRTAVKQHRPGEDDKGPGKDNKEPLSNIGLEGTTKDRCQTKSAWRGRQRTAVSQANI